MNKQNIFMDEKPLDLEKLEKVYKRVNELCDMEEQKKQKGGRREGAGRKPNAEGVGKSMYFRFRCTKKVFDIIHLHEEEGMSEWIAEAILEKQRREERY